MPAAVKRDNSYPIPEKPTRPMSIGGLADHLGVTRQRLYTMVRDGQIRVEKAPGGLMVSPAEVARVLDAAIRIDTRKGRHRLVFDFV